VDKKSRVREYFYEKRLKKYTGCYKPVFIPRKGIWVVDIPNEGVKYGDATYIAEQLGNIKVSYHFYNANPFNPVFPSCVDDFDKVVQALLERPKGFSIRGFEKEYSDQEQRVLRVLRNVLSEVERAGKKLV